MYEKKFQLRDYQLDARSNLELLASTGDFQTMLAVAVGGGKTVMAVSFIAEKMIPEGYRCFWLAPSQYLVDQAYNTIKGYGSSKVAAKVVAGDKIANHPADADYMLMTFQYAIRHLTELRNYYCGDNVIMVIDEGHHSCADSYMMTLEALKGVSSNFSLLGLSATPFRTKEEETGLLGDIYNVGVKNGQVSDSTGIAYSISMQELIRQGYLATPIVHKIATKECIMEFTSFEDDMENLATCLEYNALIVNAFLRNRELYSQTIIFAISRLHAVLLRQMLLDAGIKTGIAITTDGVEDSDIELTKGNVEADIAKFRNGDLQVLVTCKMISEGFDVPETKTVFLTKPRLSKIECTQCIGRALRKKDKDNTAYVVYFDNSVTGENISWLIPDLITDRDGEKEEKEEECVQSKSKSFLLLDDYLQVIANTKFIVTDSAEDVYNTPKGLYLYEDSKGIHSTIVYDSNYKQFEAFLGSIDSANLVDVYTELNKDNSILPITLEELEGICDNYEATSCLPVYYEYGSATNEILSVTGYVSEVEDMRTKEAKSYLEDKWKEHIILRSYYPRVHDFINKVMETL